MSYQPDDDVLWTSPYTGETTVVSYRGAYQGRAMIWTGRMQLVVPFCEIRPMESRLESN